jgi:proline iminopeptidase
MAMLHGGPGLWDYLGPVAATVDDVAMVHRFDQRGCARSTGDGPYDVATAVADVDAVRAAWGVERWTVFGHSWGASLALSYALAHSERTTGLVYVSGTGVDPAWHEEYRAARLRRIPPERRVRWHELRAKRAETSSGSAQPASAQSSGDAVERELEEMSAAADLADPSRLPDMLRWLHADGFAVNHRANRELGGDADRILETAGTAERLRDLAVPTLVIHGEDDPRPIRFARQVAELIPGARMLAMPNVGHFPRFEAPVPFTAALREFLASI